LDHNKRLMQMDWNDRARSNPFHYICSERKNWDSESFFQSGEADYNQLVKPVLTKLGFNPEGKSMLEVGCGVGRITRCFARHFATVLASDISEEMLQRGRELHRGIENVVWMHGDGTTLKDVPSDSVDFVFSFLVLQHIPSKELQMGYLSEMLRVLKPGGVYCFQFNSLAGPTMNWKGRLIWGLIDMLVNSADDSWRRAIAKRLAAALGLDDLAAGRTWRGAAMDPREVSGAVQRAGGMAPQVTGLATPRTWCYGRKGNASARSE
jgi:SAM-dependent methyltransferase